MSTDTNTQEQVNEEVDTSPKKSPKVQLKVVNMDGTEIYFQIKKTTKMGKLMTAYCKKQGLVPGSVRFTFDGNRVGTETTPNDLGMDDGDIIDAMVEQIGG